MYGLKEESTGFFFFLLAGCDTCFICSTAPYCFKNNSVLLYKACDIQFHMCLGISGIRPVWLLLRLKSVRGEQCSVMYTTR